MTLAARRAPLLALATAALLACAGAGGTAPPQASPGGDGTATSVATGAASAAGPASTTPGTSAPPATSGAAIGEPATSGIAPAIVPGTTPATVPATAPGISSPGSATASPAPTRFRFVAWGDTKVDTGTSAGQVLASLSVDAKGLSPAPVFTLYLGDLEETGFSAAAGLADDWLAHLDGGAANGTSRITFVARGNHDAIDAASTSSWQSYFDFTRVARTVGATAFTELDPGITYSFDYANAHFVCLDAPGDFPSTVTQRQLDWLEQDLATAEGRGLTHAFLYWHGPIYSVGTAHPLDERNPAPAIQRLVSIAGRHPIVSALLNGHEHLLAYKHIGPAAFPTLAVGHEFEQFTIGTGGASFHDPVPGRGDAVLPYLPAYATIDVDGRSFTVTWHALGGGASQGTFTFTK